LGCANTKAHEQDIVSQGNSGKEENPVPCGFVCPDSAQEEFTGRDW